MSEGAAFPEAHAHMSVREALLRMCAWPPHRALEPAVPSSLQTPTSVFKGHRKVQAEECLHPHKQAGHPLALPLRREDFWVRVGMFVVTLKSHAFDMCTQEAVASVSGMALRLWSAHVIPLSLFSMGLGLLLHRCQIPLHSWWRFGLCHSYCGL